MIRQNRLTALILSCSLSFLILSVGARAVEAHGSPLATSQALSSTTRHNSSDALPDTFELDNTWQTARLWNGRPIAQLHNFHNKNDEDWIEIRAPGSAHFVCDVRASAVGANADVKLALYDAANPSKLLAKDKTSGQAYIHYESDRLSHYYLRATPREKANAGIGSEYRLTIACPIVEPPLLPFIAP